MVIHLSKDDLILSDVHSTEENRSEIVWENIARKYLSSERYSPLRDTCWYLLMSNSDGGKEAPKKNSALNNNCPESSRITSLIHLPMNLSGSDSVKVLIALHQGAYRG